MNKSYNFAKLDTARLTKLINSSVTTSVLGIPGAGITLFLRHLNTLKLGRMIYIDVHSLPVFSEKELFKALLVSLGGKPRSDTMEYLLSECRKLIDQLAAKEQKVVITIVGFDLLQPEFSNSLFQNLKMIRAVDQKKVVFVFGICRRLDTILPPDLVNTDLTLLNSVHYLKPFNKEDLLHLQKAYGPASELDAKEIDRLAILSGGHFQLFQLLLNSEIRHEPTIDPFIKLAYQNILQHLNTSQKTIIRKLAIQGLYPKSDPYLEGVGIVIKDSSGYRLFSEIFTDCAVKFSVTKLPIKERRLLAVLKKNQGRIVSKREIFDAVWKDKSIGSEWALNALVYRLRKNPNFINQNYAIENHKKQGYLLTKN